MAVKLKIRYISFFYIIALWAIVASCYHPIDNGLLDAEAVIEECPDSALCLLTTLDKKKLPTERDRHIFIILLTEARYKTGLNDTSDSSIAAAARFFDPEVKNPYRLKAYYYKSILNKNSKRFGHALVDLKEAEISAEAMDNLKWKALVHRAQADMFDASKNNKQALNYYNIALKEFSIIDSTQYYAGALYDCCRSYLNLHENDSAIIIANLLDEWADRNSNHHYHRLSSSCLGDAYYNTGNYDKSITLLEKLQDEYPENISDYHLECLGLSYFNIGNMEKAEECGSILRDRHSHHLTLQRKLAEHKGDYHRAMNLMEISRHYNDSITKDWQTRSQDAILYENLILENKNADLEKSQKDLWIFIGIMLIVCLVLAGLLITLIYKSRIKERDRFLRKIHSLESDLTESSGVVEEMKKNVESKQFEINKANELLLSLQQEIENLESRQKDYNSIRSGLEYRLSELLRQKEENSSHIKELEDELFDSKLLLEKRQTIIAKSKDIIQQSIQDRYRILDTLASRYYEIKGNLLTEKNKMFEEIMKLFENIRTDSDMTTSFENIINQGLDNLMVKFRDDFQKMSDSDRSLFMFIVLDFSPKAISTFLDIPIYRFYNRKSSLKEKILRNHSINPKLYLQFI